MLLYSDHGDLDMCKLFDIKIKDLSVTLKMLNEKHMCWVILTFSQIVLCEFHPLTFFATYL